MAEASSTEEGITLRIRFKSETLEKFAARYAGDLGPGEIFVRTREPLAVGTRLAFDFTLQDGSPLLAGRGTVGWTREPDLSRSEPSGMGIRIDSLTPVGQQMLARILDIKARTALAAADAAPTTRFASARPEHMRATTPYRTVVPDDPVAALAAAGSVGKLARGGSGATSPMSPVKLTPQDLASPPAADAERTEISRMPPSFYYDAADDETTRLQEDEIIEEGTPLDDLDDITSPRAELPVHLMPTGPDLSIPWKPPTPPVAGSLAASLRPPGPAQPRSSTPQGRSGVDAPPARRPEHRETLGYGASASGGPVADVGSSSDALGPVGLRPTRTRVNAVMPGLGPDQPTPRPEPSDQLGAGLEPPVPMYEPVPVAQFWDGEGSSSRRGGTGKVWLFTGLTAAAVIVGGLWMVPKLMEPVPTAGVAPGAASGTEPPGAVAEGAGAAGAGAGSTAVAPSPAAQPETTAAAKAATPPSAAGAAAGGPGGAAGTAAASPPALATAPGAVPAAQAAKPARRVRNVRPRRLPPVSVTTGTAAGATAPTPEGAEPTAAPADTASTSPFAGTTPGASPAPSAVTGAPTPAATDEDVYWLSVKSVPPGADVLIDGLVEGKTPFQRRIFDPARTYALSIRKPGFENVERSLSASDQWLRRGNIRTLTINARLMASANPEPSAATSTEPAVAGAGSVRTPPAPAPTSEPPAPPPPAPPPAATAPPPAPTPIPERKTNPFEEPAAGGATP